MRTRWCQISALLAIPVFRFSPSISCSLTYVLYCALGTWCHKDLQPFNQLETLPSALKCEHKSMPRKFHRPQVFLKRRLNPNPMLCEERNLSHKDFLYTCIYYAETLCDHLERLMIIKLFSFNIFLSLLSLLTLWYDLSTNKKLIMIQWKSKSISTAVDNAGNNDLETGNFYSKGDDKYPAEISFSSATHLHLPPSQRYHEQKDGI